MSGPFRVALVGCGALAEILIKDVYPYAKGIEIAAVIDRDINRAEMFGSKLAVPAFKTMKEAAEAVEFEAFDLRLPHQLHADASIEGLQLDKHVLVEKPMGTSAAEARRTLAESKRYGKVLACGENYDFLECVQLAKQILTSGEIGTPVFAEVHRLFQLGAEWRRTGWRGSDSAVGGVLMENGCHIARLVEHLLGRIDHVSGYQNSYTTGGYAGDVVAVAFKTASGVVGTQTYSWTVGVPRFAIPEIRVVGDAGYLEVWVDYSGDKSGVRVCASDGSKRWIPAPQLFYSSLARVMDVFVQGCRGGSLKGVSSEEGLADVEFTDKVFAALQHTTAR